MFLTGDRAVNFRNGALSFRACGGNRDSHIKSREGFAMHDVCVVGAGPAGLNASLILGRCGRDVLVLDSGRPPKGV